MAKVNGAYDSLVRGVSQQTPAQRLPGQHTNQINMVSDPVRGLVRRQGSRRQFSGRTYGHNAEDFEKNFDTWDIKVEGEEYTLLTRRPEHPGTAYSVAAFYRDGRPGADIVGISQDSGDTVLSDQLKSGINGVAVVGRYILMAHNKPTVAVTTPVWDSAEQKRRVNISVRGGNYSKTYTVKIKFVGQPEIVKTYTTPTSSYPGVLDTSDIPWSTTDYTKKVNDRVNAYNAAVTQWIGTAAAAILPQSIAQQLGSLLVAGVTPFATLGVQGAAIIINATGSNVIERVTVEDSGDGSQIKGVWREVNDPSDLPAVDQVGTVIKVSPVGRESYYLKGTSTATGVERVVWKEAAAETVTLDNVFIIATIIGTELFVARNPTKLQELVGAYGITVPALLGRTVGDADTSPLPAFANKVVTHLSVFQDRVIIASGNIIQTSGVGDYFNFWRSTVLTVVDSDPVNIFANGSEDDVIQHAVFFDRGLVLFGDRQQYAISGKVPLTPATAAPIQSSAHKDAVGVRPIALGDYVFYAKHTGSSSQIHQIRVGAVEDTSDSVEVSQQLDGYLPGKVVSLVGVSVPDALMVRTDGAPNSVFIYRFLDGVDGARIMDSWSRWDYSPLCGRLLGLSVYKETVRGLFAENTKDTYNDEITVVHMDELPLSSSEAKLPHLDALSRGEEFIHHWLLENHPAAFGTDVAPELQWQGSDVGAYTEFIREVDGPSPLCYRGIPFESSVTLTSPIIRDRKDTAVHTGRLAVNRLTIQHANTAAYNVDVESKYGNSRSLEFRGYRVGADTNRLGEITLHTGGASAIIGRESRDYEATIRSHKWYPLTLTSIEWTGQSFNNTRRV